MSECSVLSSWVTFAANLYAPRYEGGYIPDCFGTLLNAEIDMAAISFRLNPATNKMSTVRAIMSVEFKPRRFLNMKVFHPIVPAYSECHLKQNFNTPPLRTPGENRKTILRSISVAIHVH